VSVVKSVRRVNDVDFLTPAEAAEEIGVSIATIGNYLSRGIFTTYKFKSLTLIYFEELDRYKDEQTSKV